MTTAYRDVVRAGVAVPVSPTDTVIYGPVVNYGYDSMTVAVKNDDVGVQTIDARLEVAWEVAGPWYAIPNDVLVGIEPGQAAYAVLDIENADTVRLVATASGAGCDVALSVTFNRARAPAGGQL